MFVLHVSRSRYHSSNASMSSQTTDPAETTMDISQKKVATDTQSTPTIQNQPASDQSSNSSSGNDSPDPSSRVSQSDKLQASSKSSKAAVTKGTVSSIEITEVASTMLNAPQSENRKSSTSTTNAISNEEEPRIEITGRLVSSAQQF